MVILRIFIALAALSYTASLSAQKLYSIDGKEVSNADLSASSQQAMFDLEMNKFRQTQQVIDEQLLQSYFEEKAKKSNKTAAEVEVEELKSGDPSEKELKTFFEENKSRIPPGYKYDDVKGELKRFLAEKKGMEKRQTIVAKIKKDRKFKLLLAEPVAPTVKINTDGFYSKGKSGAKVQIVEFADYQCPHCKEAAGAISNLMKKYDSKVQFVYIDFPINRSGISQLVAEGAFCANKQNKYWEFHDAAFKDQASLNKDSSLAIAKQLKLNEAEFSKCLSSAETKAFIVKSKDEGQRVGVAGTPTIYINGKKYSDAHTVDAMKKAVDKQL